MTPIGNWSNATDVILAANNISTVPALTGLGLNTNALTLDISYNYYLSTISNVSGIPGLQAAGAVLNITSDGNITPAQTSAVESALPTPGSLTITGP